MDFTRENLITVLVGSPTPTEFVVHGGVMEHSEFFKRSMNDTWTEGKTRTVNLPDDDPLIFSTYLHLLYRNTMPKHTNHENFIHRRYEDLFQLYVLAEKRQDVKTKNRLVCFVRNLSSSTNSAPPLDLVRIVFDGTPEGNEMREMVVDMWKTCLKVGHWDDDVTDQLPRDFVVMLVRSLLRIREGYEETERGSVEAYLEKDEQGILQELDYWLICER